MLSFEMAANVQARLDVEIAQLAITLSSLKTQKNTFALISRLPTSILERIFICYARNKYFRPYTTRAWPRFKKMSDATWIGVLFVCRRWRHVALTCPALWSYLFVASPWWTEALLTRSLDSPLRIWAEFYKSDMALDFIARLALHTERLQECCLCFGITQSDVVSALSMLSSSAPLLRILKITNEKEDSGKHEPAEAVNDYVLFNGYTPMLRELELTNYSIPWWPGGLTNLRLRNLATPARLTMAELRVILARSPDLIQLHLENALRRSGRNSCQDCEKLHLPSLTRLSITAPFSEIIALLSCVDIPLAAQLRLQCQQINHLPADDFIPFCTFLSQWFGASTSFIPIHSLCITSSDDMKEMRFTFGASENAASPSWFSYMEDNEEVPLSVGFIPWPLRSKRGDDAIRDICQSVPLAHLKNIFLEDYCLSSTVWADTFWHLPELRYIELICKGLSDLIETLSIPSRPPLPNTEGPKGRGPRQVFAPSLEEIILDRIAFTDQIDGYDNIYADNLKVERLYRALARRQKEAGRKLPRLGLYRCSYLYKDDVEHLRCVVEHVERLGNSSIDECSSIDEDQENSEAFVAGEV
ncbi:hypothetical protein OG21DRAFT_1444288 [Imleria badia]|nr:hypothetical protein OG21DRAFT_1444288 [Imleria badia]